MARKFLLGSGCAAYRQNLYMLRMAVNSSGAEEFIKDVDLWLEGAANLYFFEDELHVIKGSPFIKRLIALEFFAKKRCCKNLEDFREFVDRVILIRLKTQY